jgi:hypothetical protein
MLNSVKKGLFCFGLMTGLAILPCPEAKSQLIPHVWGTVGVQDEDITYGAGVRFFGFGVEVGTGRDGATGGDVLKFIGLPIVSPYVGVGYYSGDENFAYSAGVHVDVSKHIFLGAGYHSIRGINGQIGFKFK